MENKKLFSWPYGRGGIHTQKEQKQTNASQ